MNCAMRRAPNDLVKNFLGRPQNTKAFQVWMSAEFAESGSSGSSGASDKLVSPTNAPGT